MATALALKTAEIVTNNQYSNDGEILNHSDESNHWLYRMESNIYDDFDTYCPYFYIVQHKESGKKYAGIRYKNGCHPSELLTEHGYKTSSRTVHQIIDIEGLASFIILEIKLFNDVNSCKKYELDFLKNNNCRKSDEWFNQLTCSKKSKITNDVNNINFVPCDVKKSYRIKELPPYDFLHECFVYDAKIGMLIWKTRPRNHFKSDRDYNRWNKYYANKAMSNKTNGYYTICLNNTAYLAHRIIWKFWYSEDPKSLIDHINGDKLDNRIENLREALAHENSRNKKCTRISKTGFRGVYMDDDSDKFRARASLYGKNYSLGWFDTAEEASAAYLKFIKEQHGEFAHK